MLNFQFFHDLKTNTSIGCKISRFKNHQLHQISLLRQQKSLPAWHLLLPPTIEKAWETQLLHVQSKVDHSAYSFPSATGWQSSKQFHSETSDGFSEELFVVFMFWVMGMLKGFLRMKFEIRVDVFDEVLIGCFANSFKMGQCKMSVIQWYLYGWEPHSSPNLEISYLQYPNKNHHYIMTHASKC